MSILAEFQHLSVNQKVQLVQELWDQIAMFPERLPVPSWHCAELEKRQSEWESSPDTSEDWDVVRKRLRESL